MIVFSCTNNTKFHDCKVMISQFFWHKNIPCHGTSFSLILILQSFILFIQIFRCRGQFCELFILFKQFSFQMFVLLLQIQMFLLQIFQASQRYKTLKLTPEMCESGVKPFSFSDSSFFLFSSDSSNFCFHLWAGSLVDILDLADVLLAFELCLLNGVLKGILDPVVCLGDVTVDLFMLIV